jgi:hypothetical protein
MNNAKGQPLRIRPILVAAASVLLSPVALAIVYRRDSAHHAELLVGFGVAALFASLVFFVVRRRIRREAAMLVSAPILADDIEAVTIVSALFLRVESAFYAVLLPTLLTFPLFGVHLLAIRLIPLGVGVALTALVLPRALRIALIVNQTEIQIRNLTRDVRIPWAQLRRIFAGPSVLIGFETTEGRRVRAEGTVGPMKFQLLGRAELRWILDMARRRGVQLDLSEFAQRRLNFAG